MQALLDSYRPKKPNPKAIEGAPNKRRDRSKKIEKDESRAPVVPSELAFGSSVDGVALEAKKEKPNIIFILTDDLGYSDVSCYGASKVATPHIDQLAAEGIKFTDFHTGSSICSPSRAAFLTGAYPQRAGLYMGINPVRTAHWYLGLHPDEITIAEQLKEQGYATHAIGKWHLGTEPEFLPRKQGFDSCYGMLSNAGHSGQFFENENIVSEKIALNQLTQLYTERANSIIRDHAEKKEPFFLYFAHNYPHTPYKAGKDFVGSSKDGMRGDVMQELDWGIGQMMATLKESGIAENTIVIFTSDNGPTQNKYARPYRGKKYVTFEGGHRVPFIFHWPARVTQSRESNTSINAMDLFPTLTEIVGSELPTDRVYDGVSLVPLLNGQKLSRPDDMPFFYYNCENLQAVRRGEWKLHLPRSVEQLPFWEGYKGFGELKRPVLYNLTKDEAETTNVAGNHPEIVRELTKLANVTRSELGEFMQRGPAQRPSGSLFPDLPVVSHEKDWHRLCRKV